TCALPISASSSRRRSYAAASKRCSAMLQGAISCATAARGSRPRTTSSRSVMRDSMSPGSMRARGASGSTIRRGASRPGTDRDGGCAAAAACGARASLKRHLREAAELPRMQPLALLRPQALERVEADVEMLADPLPVELARHAGELDLAVHRFVRNAEQRAVRHPEAEPVRRARRRLHVERDRTRLRELADLRRGVADLPVAVVDAADRAGPHHALQLESGEAGDGADGLLERDLHLR